MTDIKYESELNIFSGRIHLLSVTVTNTNSYILMQVKLMEYETLIGIYHQGGAHWTAVVSLFDL